MLCCYTKDGIVFDRLLLQLELIFFAADFNVFSKAYSVKTQLCLGSSGSIFCDFSQWPKYKMAVQLIR